MEGPGAPILFATDFSSGSQHALPYAVSLARASRSQLILLHAVPPSIVVLPTSMDASVVNMEISAEILSDALSRARQQMAELISAEAMLELNPETIIDCAPADEMILRTAEKNHAGLIVMGAHRASLNPVLHSVASHLSWGTTVSAVVCKAPCPVLTVRS
jgi:nucleotide-binding universal stress UspA family protein